MTNGALPPVGAFGPPVDKKGEALAKVFQIKLEEIPYGLFELECGSGSYQEVPPSRMAHLESPDGTVSVDLVGAELHIRRATGVTRIGLSDEQRFGLQYGTLFWANERYLLLNGDETHRQCFVDQATGEKNRVFRKPDHVDFALSPAFDKIAIRRPQKTADAADARVDAYLGDLENDARPRSDAWC